MKIRRKFLQLTTYTYPYGSEGFMKCHLPPGFIGDGMGNYYYVIGENPTTMFTCHLDTACSKQEKVIQIQDSRYIKTNGKTILGADDKAGMLVLLYMIENKIPGLYYFFIGEEVGCIGSGRVADTWLSNPFSKTIKKIISFDRHGTNSVITHQFYGRCCSDEFAKELSTRLNQGIRKFNFKPDNTGISTDSASFIYLVPECTNVSVGYSHEHTFKETQDILFLQDLCNSVIKIDWETLPVSRNPVALDLSYFDDYKLEWSNKYFSFFKCGKIVKKMYISKSQIRKEKAILHQWIFENGISKLTDKKIGCSNNSSFDWNGNELFIENDKGKMEPISKRLQIMQIIPEIGGVSASHLRFDPKIEMDIMDY